MDSDETRKMDLEVLDKVRGTTLQYIKFYSTRFPCKDNSSNIYVIQIKNFTDKIRLIVYPKRNQKKVTSLSFFAKLLVLANIFNLNFVVSIFNFLA